MPLKDIPFMASISEYIKYRSTKVIDNITFQNLEGAIKKWFLAMLLAVLG